MRDAGFPAEQRGRLPSGTNRVAIFHRKWVGDGDFVREARIRGSSKRAGPVANPFKRYPYSQGVRISAKSHPNVWFWGFSPESRMASTKKGRTSPFKRQI